MSIADLAIPAVLLAVICYGVLRGCPVFDCFMQGAREGLDTVLRIFPAMMAIMLALGVLRSSGALDLLRAAIEPATSAAGVPSEVVPLMILRPISGAGALAVFKDIIAEVGPDSFAGRVASVMQGSTETTFYTIAIYYGATRVKNTRHTLGAAAAGDISGFIMSVLTVGLLMGS